SEGQRRTQMPLNIKTSIVLTTLIAAFAAFGAIATQAKSEPMTTTLTTILYRYSEIDPTREIAAGKLQIVMSTQVLEKVDGQCTDKWVHVREVGGQARTGYVSSFDLRNCR